MLNIYVQCTLFNNVLQDKSYVNILSHITLLYLYEGFPFSKIKEVLKQCKCIFYYGYLVLIV